MFSIALYSTEAQQRLSFNAELRLEPGSSDPYAGPVPWCHTGWDGVVQNARWQPTHICQNGRQDVSNRCGYELVGGAALYFRNTCLL